MKTDYFQGKLSINEVAALLNVHKSELKEATQSASYEIRPGIKAPQRSHMGLTGFFFDGPDVKRCMIELGLLKVEE